ncbi:glycosyltransferase family 2 protein [Marinicrinis sediminis]|uniref:Glycosyltransferase family 2 protein n=1 Tax=Marinicrinis sediminis TaxID=1652465 RepID=A0ABW5R767_9BACL
MDTSAVATVVIPTFHRLMTLAEALESLSRQSEKRFEVIIVNDGGTDVMPVVACYPELLIKVISFPRNRGHVAARNAAIKQAVTRYIMLLDDDDLVAPRHMELMLEALEREQAQLVYSDAEIFRYEMGELGRQSTTRTPFSFAYDPVLLRSFLTIIPSGTLYERSVHDKIGLLDEEVANYWDWDFFLRVSASCKVTRLPVASTFYAFSGRASDHQSAQFTPKRGRYLARLCSKHGLGMLKMENFDTMTRSAELAARQAVTRRIWDGSPIYSRYPQSVKSSPHPGLSSLPESDL